MAMGRREQLIVGGGGEAILLLLMPVYLRVLIFATIIPLYFLWLLFHSQISKLRLYHLKDEY